MPHETEVEVDNTTLSLFFGLITVALAGVALLLSVKAYVSSVYTYSTKVPRLLAVTYLVLAWYFAGGLFLLAFVTPVHAEHAFDAAATCSYLIGAIFQLLGPALVFIPLKPIVVKSGIMRKIVVAAQKEESRKVAMGAFVLVSLSQAFVTYALWQLFNDRVGLDVRLTLGITIGYALTAVFYLVAFYSIMMRTRIIVNGIDLLSRLRTELVIDLAGFCGVFCCCCRHFGVEDTDGLSRYKRPWNPLFSAHYAKAYVAVVALLLIGSGTGAVWFFVQRLDDWDDYDTLLKVIVVTFFVLEMLLLLSYVAFTLNAAFRPAGEKLPPWLEAAEKRKKGVLSKAADMAGDLADSMDESEGEEDNDDASSSASGSGSASASSAGPTAEILADMAESKAGKQKKAKRKAADAKPKAKAKDERAKRNAAPAKSSSSSVRRRKASFKESAARDMEMVNLGGGDLGPSASSHAADGIAFPPSAPPPPPSGPSAAAPPPVPQASAAAAPAPSRSALALPSFKQELMLEDDLAEMREAEESDEELADRFQGLIEDSAESMEEQRFAPLALQDVVAQFTSDVANLSPDFALDSFGAPGAVWLTAPVSTGLVTLTVHLQPTVVAVRRIIIVWEAESPLSIEIDGYSMSVGGSRASVIELPAPMTGPIVLRLAVAPQSIFGIRHIAFEASAELGSTSTSTSTTAATTGGTSTTVGRTTTASDSSSG